MATLVTTIDNECEPLLKNIDNKPTKKSYRNSLTMICLIIVGSIITYELLSSSHSESSAPIQQDSVRTSKVLFTNNPNEAYLCDTEFLYHDVNIYPEKYQFSCAMISSFG